MTVQPVPNVWATCQIQIIDFSLDENGDDKATWKTVATVPYTPRHIREALQTAGLTSAWVRFMGNRTLQTLNDIHAS